jgi:hypothetical protein
MSVRGRIQREGDVVQHLTDLSAELSGVDERDDGFPLPHGRGDEFHHGSTAQGAAAAGYLHFRPAHRQHQGEDEGCRVNAERSPSCCPVGPRVPVIGESFSTRTYFVERQNLPLQWHTRQLRGTRLLPEWR